MAILEFKWLDFFWEKFSFYFKQKDTYKDDQGKGLFQRYLEVYGYELKDIEPLWEEYIQRTRDLDTCQDEYLPLIANDLGSPPNPLGTLVGLRKILKYLVTVYKIKGTLESLQIILEILGYDVIIDIDYHEDSLWDFQDIDNDNPMLWDEGNWDELCPTCVHYSILINSNTDNPGEGDYTDISLEDLNDLLEIIQWLEPIDATLTGINHNIVYCEDVPLGILEELEVRCFAYSLWDDGNWDEIDFDTVFDCGTTLIEGDVLPAVPANLTIAATMFNLTINWDAADDALEYVLEYRVDGETDWVEVILTGLELILSSPTIIYEETYNIRVKSRNTIGDSDYTTIQDGVTLPIREVGAVGHWILGSDNPNYNDLEPGNVLYQPLAAIGSGHFNETNYCSMMAEGTSPYMHGLRSHLADKASEQTVFLVGKLVKDDDLLNPYAYGGLIAGNLNVSGTEGGIGIFQQRYYNNNQNNDFHKLYLTDRNSNPSMEITPTSPDEFFFIAWSVDGTTKKILYCDSSMAAPVITNQTGVISISNPVRKLSFGNTYYSHTNYRLGTNIAEGGIIQSSHSNAELTAIFDRSVLRMAERGLSIKQ